VQFICTGIVTEMLARTYFEAGGNRTYLVREVLGGTAEGQGEEPGHGKEAP
jgi:hypothetical protein